MYVTSLTISDHLGLLWLIHQSRPDPSQPASMGSDAGWFSCITLAGNDRDSVQCLKGIFQTLRLPSPSTLPSNLELLGPFVKKLLKLTSVAMLMFPL